MPMSTDFFILAVLAQRTLVPFLKGEKKKHRKFCQRIQAMKKTSSKNSVSREMWMPQWSTDAVVYLLCTWWFFFTTHSGFSSPESQSQVEWQESSATSVHFWILANGLLWRLESRVWKYYLQTPGFLKVWTQNARNFIWHFEQTLRVSILLMKLCISLCFKRKKDLTIHLCELYGWGDLGWCGK